MTWNNSLQVDALKVVPSTIFNASASLEPRDSDILTAADGDVLAVPAVLIDTVDQALDIRKIVSKLCTCVRNHHNVPREHLTADRDDTGSRTRRELVTIFDAAKRPEWWKTASDRLQEMTHALACCYLYFDTIVTNALAGLTEQLCDRRRFIVTDNYMGIGPGDTKRGDIICIILGAQIPFVLRPDGDYYRIVGLACIHGIMFGEAMEGIEVDTPKVQTLRIR
jgi:hypothetical protein